MQQSDVTFEERARVAAHNDQAGLRLAIAIAPTRPQQALAIFRCGHCERQVCVTNGDGLSAPATGCPTAA